ncbi:hypothetical protein Q8A67_019066 [Cirrhinus molitorella]|uniref:Uncharacterized protein n=1 Tax=Cirrhinus molitorella TaxID=172907 RepID=A0AA88TEQ0_9TELE|nr:hypothetical protein Q8A67_019066 [Cirrhinus molitorella]
MERTGGSKKSKAGTREGRGLCVCRVSYLITGETSNGPRRSFEARERPPLWLPLMKLKLFLGEFSPSGSFGAGMCCHRDERFSKHKSLKTTADALSDICHKM